MLLLIVGLSAWNAKAMPLTGIVGVQPKTYSLLEKAACNEADPLCKQGAELTCSPGLLVPIVHASSVAAVGRLSVPTSARDGFSPVISAHEIFPLFLRRL